MFEAATIMQTNVPITEPDTTIKTAIHRMNSEHLTGLPVLNPNRTLAGMLSEKDVLRLIYEKQNANGFVNQFMTIDPVSFETDATIMEICQCIINNNFRQIPVTENGKFAGLISRKDLMNFLLRLRGKQEQGN